MQINIYVYVLTKAETITLNSIFFLILTIINCRGIQITPYYLQRRLEPGGLQTMQSHTQEVGRNTRRSRVFLPTLLSCSNRFLRALQQNRAQSRLLYLLKNVKDICFHSVLLGGPNPRSGVQIR